MRRLLTASVLFTLVLFTTATGQPQPKAKAPPEPRDLIKEAKDRDLIEKQREKVLADTAVAAALANDPDVRMAKAKIQLAEAEYAKARQGVTLKVLTLKSAIERHKAEIAAAEQRVAFAAALFQRGVGSQAQLLDEREKLETAKAALATAETEWKLITGPAGAGVGATDPQSDAVAAALRSLGVHTANDEKVARLLYYKAIMEAARARDAIKGPIPERLRTALDKPVKLGAKGEKITFEKALEVFKKDAGLDVPVRGTYPKAWPILDKDGQPILDANRKPVVERPAEIVSEGEELPVGAWLQLFEDKAVLTNRNSPPDRFRFYVREYGILIAHVSLAPPDALTLTEFWKQKPPTKEPKSEPKTK